MMAASHLITALVFVLIGMWVGRRTTIFSGFIKPAAG